MSIHISERFCSSQTSYKILMSHLLFSASIYQVPIKCQAVWTQWWASPGGPTLSGLQVQWGGGEGRCWSCKLYNTLQWALLWKKPQHAQSSGDLHLHAHPAAQGAHCGHGQHRLLWVLLPWAPQCIWLWISEHLVAQGERMPPLIPTCVSWY